MLIVALVLAVVGLAALVTAVVTSNELVAWVCIAASVLGVILLIIDAVRERQHRDDGSVPADATAATATGAGAASGEAIDATYQNFDAEYPEEPAEGADSTPAVTSEEAEAADAPTAVHPIAGTDSAAHDQGGESSADDDATKGSR